MQTFLERRQPEDNLFRFYRLELDRDLFGAWCVTRNWGRIGTRGQSRLLSFATRAEARSALQGIEAAKRRRGYAPPASA